jgi:SAM-dependent methyltransferase
VKIFYDAWYRFGTPPWVGPARPELVGLVESGALSPGRALDLGCGTGDNAVFLARHGFDVTAVDFAPAAIAAARAKADQAGVDVKFLVDDLTRLTAVRGRFDLLVDYGTFDDLSAGQRAAYVRQVVPRADEGARFLLWCFEWEPRAWERLAIKVLPFGGLALRPGEVRHWFGHAFDIEEIAGETGLPSWPRGWAAYLMTRRPQPTPGQ